MKKIRMGFMLLVCLLGCVSLAQANVLKVDFGRPNTPVAEGFEAYTADHEQAGTFTAQDFDAFGTEITITPAWAAGATPQAMQMIDRGGNDGSPDPDLLREWIGTDTRQPGNPMTLTLSGLPGGVYSLLTYHHDPENQTGVFHMTVSDATGDTTTEGLEITDKSRDGITTLDAISTVSTTFTANGSDDVVLVFEQVSANPIEEKFFVMNGFVLERLSAATAASTPSPEDGDEDIDYRPTLSWIPGDYADSHNIYLSKIFADVNDGIALEAEGLPKTTTQYIPGTLDFGATYFWRVDEVNAPSDPGVHPGSVWSFTVEPEGYPVDVDLLTVSASGQLADEQGPEKAVNGAGLAADGTHDVELTNMWLSDTSVPGAAWLQIDMNEPVKLSGLHVWNHNSANEKQPIPAFSMGAKVLLVEYSLDGETWESVGEVEIAKATGEDTYAGEIVALGGVYAKSVKITIQSGYGLYGLGLSEVQLLAVPTSAREMSPANGVTDLDPRDVELSWRPGREAAIHRLYISTDEQAVIDGTVSAIDLTDSMFVPDVVMGSTYFWRIDEVNDVETPATWSSDVYSFSTANTIVVDDMEAYFGGEGDNPIWGTWSDGYDTDDNGARVGDIIDFLPETTIVFSGNQSMPLTYGFSGIAKSWTTRTFDEAQDWSRYDIKGLTLYFYGLENNQASSLYLMINEEKIAYDGDAESILRKPWHFWYVDLSTVPSATLKAVTSLTIGLDGGQGQIMVDDIVLTPAERNLVSPVAPGTDDLLAHYAFEGNANDSAGSNDATVTGAPLYVDGKVGQAIQMNGTMDYLLVEGAFELPTYSVSAWFRSPDLQSSRDILSMFTSDGGHGIILELQSDGKLRYLHRFPFGTGGGSNIYSSPGLDDGNWHHVAIVKDTVGLTMYIDGEFRGSVEDEAAFETLHGYTMGVLMPSNLIRYYSGELDELMMYQRALTPAEVVSLAGRNAIDMP